MTQVEFDSYKQELDIAISDKAGRYIRNADIGTATTVQRMHLLELSLERLLINDFVLGDTYSSNYLSPEEMIEVSTRMNNLLELNTNSTFEV